MTAACPTADIGLLTLSWITEQLRAEVARREEEEREEPRLLTWRRQATLLLAGGLSGVSLFLMRICA
jgi:hypothetical protein